MPVDPGPRIRIELRFSRRSVDPDTDWDPDPGSYKKKEKITF